MSEYLDYQGLMKYHGNALKAFEFSMTIKTSDWNGVEATIESQYLDSDPNYIYIADFVPDGYGVKMRDVILDGYATFDTVKQPTEDITVNVLKFEVHEHGQSV